MSEAARQLGVHTSTIRRWIAQGRLRAYRVGPKGIRVRQGDLALLLTPVSAHGPGGTEANTDGTIGIRRLTPAEKRRGMAVIDEARRAQQRLLETRQGRHFSPSWEMVNADRDARTEQLLGEPSE